MSRQKPDPASVDPAHWEALLAAEGLAEDTGTEPTDEPTEYEAGLEAADDYSDVSDSDTAEEDDSPPVDLEGNLHSFTTVDPDN